MPQRLPVFKELLTSYLKATGRRLNTLITSLLASAHHFRACAAQALTALVKVMCLACCSHRFSTVYPTLMHLVLMLVIVSLSETSMTVSSSATGKHTSILINQEDGH